jgi:PAS domain S-box-containing protein
MALGERHRRALGRLEREIAERAQKEHELRESEERLRIAQKAGHSGTWEWNFETKELITSPEMRDLFGFDATTAGGEREYWRERVNAEDLEGVNNALQHAVENREDYHVEFRITRADGAERRMESLGRIFHDERGNPTRNIGVTTDITERKQAEEALKKSHHELERRVEERTQVLAATLAKLEAEVEAGKERERALRVLSGRLLRLQDEERRRIARDLHDSTGQTLAALKMTLGNVKKLLEDTPKGPALVSEIAALADQAIQDLRTTSHLLHPPLLDEMGFSSAAKWYVDGFAKRSGIEARLELSELPSLSEAAELVFFRVLQESLTNVVRHSGSKSVEIRVSSSGGNAILSIKDFGNGISPDKLTSFEAVGLGVGLSSMKERLKELGGDLKLEYDGTGTYVIAALPFVTSEGMSRMQNAGAGQIGVAN